MKHGESVDQSQLQSNLHKFVLNGKAYLLKMYRKWYNHEGQILSMLQHPHIVRHVEHGIHEGRPYVIMEWVEGVPLSARQRLTEVQASQLQAIMEYLRLKEVRHREIKPEHILIDKQENIKLIDFGMASTPTMELQFDDHYLATAIKTNEKYGMDDGEACRKILEEYKK